MASQFIVNCRLANIFKAASNIFHTIVEYYRGFNTSAASGKLPVTNFELLFQGLSSSLVGRCGAPVDVL